MYYFGWNSSFLLGKETKSSRKLTVEVLLRRTTLDTYVMVSQHQEVWRRGEPPDRRDYDGRNSHGEVSEGQQQSEKESIGTVEIKGEISDGKVNRGIGFTNKLPCLIMHQCVGRQGSLLTETEEDDHRTDGEEDMRTSARTID